jgi:hypothetical protein
MFLLYFFSYAKKNLTEVLKKTNKIFFLESLQAFFFQNIVDIMDYIILLQ